MTQRFQHVVSLSVSENHMIRKLLEQEAVRLRKNASLSTQEYFTQRWSEEALMCEEAAVAMRKAFIDPVLT
jgi:hypothetical protein